MGKQAKIWLMIAISLVILGGSIFSAAMWACDWDFTKLDTKRYETVTYAVGEDFLHIAMDTDTEDILFVPSDDGQCRVVCIAEENITHSVAVQNDTLIVNTVDRRQWYEYIGINLRSPKITVYIPQREYGALSIKASTGDVKIESFQFESIVISQSTGDIHITDITADSLTLSVSTGSVTVCDVTCEKDVRISVSTGKSRITDTLCGSLLSTGNTGDITLENVIASEKFTIETDTGDVKFYRSDAAEVFIETDTGDVTGSLLTGKVFIVESDTGSIHVPKTVTGGRCEITTDTGDVKITVE